MVARRVGGNRVPPSCEPGQQDAGDHEGNKCRTQPLVHHPRPYGSPGLLPDLPAEGDAYEGRSIGDVHDKSAPTVGLDDVVHLLEGVMRAVCACRHTKWRVRIVCPSA